MGIISSWNQLKRAINPRNPQGAESGGKVSISWLRKRLGMVPSDSESGETVSLQQRGTVVDQLAWTDGNSAIENEEYDYVMPLERDANSIEADLIRSLASTPAFTRLRDVRFLGALDYYLVTSPNARNRRYTRFQHSLGVAALAKSYLDMRQHAAQQRLLCVAAAMLHDIGHPPFSHTIEPVFEQAFGFDHHRASERIISGQVPLGSEVAEVLGAFGIDPLAVIDVLNGGDALYESFFSGPINFDTIEGILRSRNYLKMQRLGLSPLKVMQAAADRGKAASEQTVDSFWQCKHDVYTLVIRSRHGVLYDGLFQAVVNKSIDALSPTDFFASESDIFRKVPLLREALKREKIRVVAEDILPAEMHYQARHFFVDEQVPFASRRDKERYRQTKSSSSLTLRDVLPA